MLRTLALAGWITGIALVLEPAGRVFLRAAGQASMVGAQSAGTFTATGNMKTARGWGHTATLLSDGKVLVVGGANCESYCDIVNVHDSAEVYDPATGTWSDTGSLLSRRASHSATLLPNGQVLVVGGTDGAYHRARYCWRSAGSRRPLSL